MQDAFDINDKRFDIEARKQILETQNREVLGKMLAACSAGDKLKAELCFEQLLQISELKRFLGSLVDDDHAIYVIGSLFLYECHAYLTKQRVEALHYVSGIQLGNILTLDRLLRVEMDRQSASGASGEPVSSHETLVELEQFGHRAHALFHSHPGQGSNATFPSPTDMETQERHEIGGYPMIGGIFTVDGWVRFYSAKRPFEVFAYGEGVENVEDKTYHLTKISALRDQRT